MKKLTIKLMALVMGSIAMANASSLSRLPRDVLAHLGSYLTVEDQLVLASTNHQQAYGQSVKARRIYAECIVQNTPVPQEIKSILCQVKDKERQEEISEEIAKHISNRINGGFLHHRKSLPPFLHSYFYQIAPQDLHLVLDQNISDGSIPSQALLHMKTCGTYWVDNQTTQERMDELILDHAKSSYISFQKALQLPADRAIPKYISATETEVRDRNNTVPLNSFFALNPNAVLVIDVERSTTLANFSGSLTQNVKHIVFTGSHITHIGSTFLTYCYRLTTLDLSPLSNVTSIRGSFLFNCKGLTTLDLSPLSNIRSIGGYFLNNCTGLTRLDLSPLSKVTSIEYHFLSGCTSLTTLDLSPLSNVTSIICGFLTLCTGLTTLDLSGLSNVTSIGDFFLSSCRGLTTLDLSPLSNVTSIEDWFLYEGKGLRTLDLSPLSNVTSIGEHFLRECNFLTTLDLSGLSNVTSIGDGFLHNCNVLQDIIVTKDSYIERTLRGQCPRLIPFIRYKN